MTKLAEELRGLSPSAEPHLSASLREVADELDLAAALFDPDDLLPCLKRLNAAVARATRMYNLATESEPPKAA